jgi:hypothetical protein
MYSAFARNWPFRPATVPLPWSKASKIQGEGPRWSWEWKSHKIFVCTRNAAVDKNAPSMGALRGAPLSLGPSAQNLGSKSAFPRPWWALDIRGCHRAVRSGGSSCLSAGPAVVGTPHGPSWHSQMPLVVNFRVKK